MMMVRGPWSLCFQRTGLRPLAAWHTNCTLGIQVAFRLDMTLLPIRFSHAFRLDMTFWYAWYDLWLLIFDFLICFSTLLPILFSQAFFVAAIKLFLSWEFQTEKVFASVYIFQYSYLSLYLQCTFASTMQHISKVAKLSERMALFYMKFEFSKEGYLLQPK